MSMNVKTSSGGGDGEMSPVAEINVTPLVDVMLVLLIIFMVTMPLMMSQLPVTLPRPNPTPQDKPPDKLTVGFDASYQYYLQINNDPRESIDYSALPARLNSIVKAEPDKLITVCADPSVMYDRVVDLMGLVGHSGFSKVSICP